MEAYSWQSQPNAVLCPPFSWTASTLSLPAMNIDPFKNGFKINLAAGLALPSSVSFFSKNNCLPRASFIPAIHCSFKSSPYISSHLKQRFCIVSPHPWLWKKKGEGDRNVLGLVTSQCSLWASLQMPGKRPSSIVSNLKRWHQKNPILNQIGRKRSHLETAKTLGDIFFFHPRAIWNSDGLKFEIIWVGFSQIQLSLA